MPFPELTNIMAFINRKTHSKLLQKSAIFNDFNHIEKHFLIYNIVKCYVSARAVS